MKATITLSPEEVVLLLRAAEAVEPEDDASRAARKGALQTLYASQSHTEDPAISLLRRRLRVFFPWLGTDESVDGADVIDALNDLYDSLPDRLSDEPSHDDTVKFCPECMTPNQFGELCPACRREENSRGV